MRTVAIVASAGSGTRLGLRTKKPFVRVAGAPLVVHTLSRLAASRAIDSIIVAVDSSCVRRLAGLIRRYRIGKIQRIVVGGKTRFESVRNCLEAVGCSFDIVLIHDGVRPLVTDEVIRTSIARAARYGGAVVAVPEQDTVKSVRSNGSVERTLDRTRIFRAQTPQAFRRSLIIEAYKRARRGFAHFTDDASLVERMGKTVKIVPGSYQNIKITTREDLAFARALLKSKF